VSELSQTPLRIYLDTVGCRLNQSEIEIFARQFRAAGHALVSTLEEADLVVVNTCAVTAQAAADSRKKIRAAQRAGAGEVIATGCWSTLEPQKAAGLPGVSRVVPNTAKDHLVPLVLDLPAETFDLEPIEREPIPGARLRTRAFIKVQDGCDNRCTFCITTVARGPGRSLPLANILESIQAALDGGAQEIVLTGVHLGSWGHDFETPRRLRELVEIILERTAVPRLRLSSLEPWDLEPDFFSLWQDRRLCRQLHLPLQSGSDATLRRMARRTTRQSFAGLVAAARQVSPEIAITTDVITGFPGENEAEFAESLAFIQAMEFAGGHVFTYSARPGTAAARMPDQVPHPLRKERNAAVRAALQASGERYRQRFLNRTLPVLWESATALGPQGWTLSGLSDNYLRVTARAPQHLWNQITPVQIRALENGGLTGELVSSTPARD
jgi:threonylcarbamoyladenosine tRNA methylthiotransferase MtaB